MLWPRRTPPIRRLHRVRDLAVLVLVVMTSYAFAGTVLDVRSGRFIPNGANLLERGGHHHGVVNVPAPWQRCRPTVMHR